MAVRLAQLVRHMLLLGHAAAQADDLFRVAPLTVNQSAHVAQHPLLGVLPDGAGIDDDEVGIPVCVRHLIPHLGEHTPEQLGIRFVLLAAVSVHIGQGHLPSLCVEGTEFRAVLLLPADVLLRHHRGLSLHGKTPPLSYRILKRYYTIKL